MSLHYLRPVRLGPARATAQRHGPVAEVMVTDEGRESALAVAATTRLFEP
ncbi:MAG: hypothetical protein U5K30_02840 [Acidimicrobiales bacterium]|nr:hypothetical protein [Acidimicrobiales bacterium]